MAGAMAAGTRSWRPWKRLSLGLQQSQALPLRDLHPERPMVKLWPPERGRINCAISSATQDSPRPSVAEKGAMSPAGPAGPPAGDALCGGWMSLEAGVQVRGGRCRREALAEKSREAGAQGVGTMISGCGKAQPWQRLGEDPGIGVEGARAGAVPMGGCLEVDRRGHGCRGQCRRLPAG